ncbi:hypothetical protein [Ponticoccus litoralis]|uniref:Uncharacterized protein n=1 Tax=Ponticoccus litoralis TaxID=422297 RepID=A0AAW9SHT3_9RHOB
MEYRARWIGGVLRLMTNQPPALDEGEAVFVSIERARSPQSHKHQFAWINDAWASLPDSCLGMPWAETPETLRKHALIATGFHRTYTLDCGANATARRIKAELVRAEARAEGYAIGQVRGPVLTIWTPESQSTRAMGRERFQESKTAILDWIADKLGVTADDLRRSAA